jgi:hypothetical protein
MACVREFGEGNFEAPLEKFPGKKVFINTTIEQIRANLKALMADASMLSKAAVEGKHEPMPPSIMATSRRSSPASIKPWMP